MKLADLSNEEVLSGLHTLIGHGRVLLARLLAYLGEVEERRLDLQSACSSLFDFCVRRLGMSDDKACRRVTASRLTRRFPMALGMLERGELHLTALLMLRERLTDDNHEELLHAAAGKSKTQVQELLAARFPRPDAPSLIRTLPEPTIPPAAGTTSPPKAGRVEPLSPDRYEVRFTATKALKEKLEHATNLMRHANPRGDLAMVVERALDHLIDELEKRRLGKAIHPSKTPAKPLRPGYVPRAVRREVFERDGTSAPLSTNPAGAANRGHSSSSITSTPTHSAAVTMPSIWQSGAAATIVSPPNATSGASASIRRKPKEGSRRASADPTSTPLSAR